MDLKGKNVLIIGGSSGMGLATARLAFQQGANVTITGTTEASATQAASTIGAVSTYALDVTDEAGVNQFFARFTKIDHVFVAAGTTKLSNFLDGNVADQLVAFNIRLLGSIYVVRAAAAKMRAGGSFVFTGGVSTDRPVKGAWVSGIGTSTAEQLARVLALELAPIRFNAVSPGWTDTPMWDTVLGENKQALLDGVAQTLPVGRIAQPEEVAEAVVFLMRNESVTGEIIHIDGGGRLV
ncbi:SDR family oxidoreductase [Spirosoma arcticum]